MEFIEFDGVYKYYSMGQNRIAAANGISFCVKKGEFCVVVGPSGAGKTTLLNMLGGMDSCDEGRITVDGAEVSAFNKKQLTAYRRYDVGFVFQFYNLVQNLTALENVELASEICREPLDAEQTLRKVGLGERMNNFPAQLSGGEQQRAAIARALSGGARLLLADEPTGNLDGENSRGIVALLRKLAGDGCCVVVVTHDMAIAAEADRVYEMRDGRLSLRSGE